MSQTLAVSFKQSDVGLIPTDWDVTTVGEALQFYSGKAHEAYVSKSGKFVVVNSKFISTDGKVRKFCTRNLMPARAGDVLMVMSDLPNGRALAKCFLVDRDNVYAVNQRVCIFRSRLHDPRYLRYILNRNPYYMAFDDGVQQTHLLNDPIKRCPIPLPSVVEQSTIADALSDADELIGTLERLIAKKEAIKQGVMQQLLTGKTRLPGFTAKWVLQRVGDFASVGAGGTPSTSVPRYWGGPIRWMSSGELHQKRVSEVAGRITEAGLRESNAHLLPTGSVLIGLAGQGRTRGTVAVSRIQLSTNQSIASILPSTKHSSDFLYYNLDTRYEELRGMSTGEGGRGGLNLAIIRSISIKMPDVEEQQAIARVLTIIDDELDSMQARLIKTKAIKQGMMQDLLTGRTRLPVKATGV